MVIIINVGKKKHMKLIYIFRIISSKNIQYVCSFPSECVCKVYQNPAKYLYNIQENVPYENCATWQISDNIKKKQNKTKRSGSIAAAKIIQLYINII